jgi:hypothetical protein
MRYGIGFEDFKDNSDHGREYHTHLGARDEDSHKWSQYADEGNGRGGKFTGPGFFQEEVIRAQANGESLEDFNPRSCTWPEREGE